MKKNIDERKLTKSFLNSMIEENYCASEIPGKSHSALDYDGQGIVSEDELYDHFDLNQDGIVTNNDYKNHIDYHCAHPETLDHYNQLSSQSIETVPCRPSYEHSSSYCLSDPESMQSLLSPIMNATGSSCQISAIQGLLDVIKSMKECGLI